MWIICVNENRFFSPSTIRWCFPGTAVETTKHTCRGKRHTEEKSLEVSAGMSFPSFCRQDWQKLRPYCGLWKVFKARARYEIFLQQAFCLFVLRQSLTTWHWLAWNSHPLPLPWKCRCWGPAPPGTYSSTKSKNLTTKIWLLYMINAKEWFHFSFTNKQPPKTGNDQNSFYLL